MGRLTSIVCVDISLPPPPHICLLLFLLFFSPFSVFQSREFFTGGDYKDFCVLLSVIHFLSAHVGRGTTTRERNRKKKEEEKEEEDRLL